MALAAIRKGNYRHFISLFAVVSHTKEHMQNNVLYSYQPRARFYLLHSANRVHEDVHTFAC
ncbi:hypothetical protein B5M10_21445 [Pluralibacter gergoviae]|nr:hypothetical protein A8H26_18655 [Pluralibacter gergoviae]OUQ94162.1 hypothetical protein B5M10_21445 [Pluralibacter gergoviae]